MTALFVLAGLATLLLLLALDGGLRDRWPLVPGVVAASVTALAAGWLPTPGGPLPGWLGALLPIALALAFAAVAARFRRGEG